MAVSCLEQPHSERSFWVQVANKLCADLEMLSIWTLLLLFSQSLQCPWRHQQAMYDQGQQTMTYLSITYPLPHRMPLILLLTCLEQHFLFLRFSQLVCELWAGGEVYNLTHCHSAVAMGGKSHNTNLGLCDSKAHALHCDWRKEKEIITNLFPSSLSEVF